MRKTALLLCLALAAFSPAKDISRDLWSSQPEKRLAAAKYLADKARAQGLTAEEVQALAESLEDKDDRVRKTAARALSLMKNESAAAELAAVYGADGDNLVAFLLWFAVLRAKEAFINAVGEPAPGDLHREIRQIKESALAAYANILDPARQELAQPYYKELSP